MENQTNQQLPYEHASFPPEEQLERAKAYLEELAKRRSIRAFSSRPVEKELIETLLKTAATAPSGVNRQPYTFCAVSNKKIKRKIREAAEKEEFVNYNGRMDQQWIQDLQPLGTNWHKAFLEDAPWLIVAFRKGYDIDEAGKHQNYNVQESVGIACGFLVSAIHHAGLVTLTHTPTPMQFLQRILKRPENEKPFLLLPVGYPQEGATVPKLLKKTPEEYIVWYEK